MTVPYTKYLTLPILTPSSAGHVEPGVNLGGPSPKAKYSLATDSAKYREGKVKSTPSEGSEIEPETMCLQAVRALWHSFRVQWVIACLLLNDPAS